MTHKSETVSIPKRPKRHFLPEDFKVESWEQIKPYYEQLADRDLGDVESLKQWFKDRSELESVLAEDLGWRYIRMTCDTTNEQLQEAFHFFVEQIEPEIAPYSDQLNKKALDSPYLKQVKNELGYDILIRDLEKEVEIFRQKNIPLLTKLNTRSQEYGNITGSMTVMHDDKELTLQQASVLLQENDRVLREKIYHKICDRRLEEREVLDDLFDELIDLRDEVAKNADFPNYRDYMFRAMGRFDYSPAECFAFHEAVAHEVVPMLEELAEERKATLQTDSLRPWDKDVDPDGKPPLKPFEGGADLLEKTIHCFDRLDPFLGECLTIMKEMGHLDLESRKGKAPGGYNYPLAEIGVPFIFMNATSTVRDMVTLLHEGGHAVHSFVTRELPLHDFKETPSEVAELASMTMELITMDHWDLFFSDPEELKRAKKEHLEQIIQTLPWVACIDNFQHWLYENPVHTVEERQENWLKIFERFSDQTTDWTGLDKWKRYIWQKQLHLYEVPFYYIEYGMAQLGAIAIWKNFTENPQKALQDYLAALKLGYTKNIREIYETAGIRFDFSKEYIGELMNFVRDELKKYQ